MTVRFLSEYNVFIYLQLCIIMSCGGSCYATLSACFHSDIYSQSNQVLQKTGLRWNRCGVGSHGITFLVIQVLRGRSCVGPHEIYNSSSSLSEGMCPLTWCMQLRKYIHKCMEILSSSVPSGNREWVLNFRWSLPCSKYGDIYLLQVEIYLYLLTWAQMGATDLFSSSTTEWYWPFFFLFTISKRERCGTHSSLFACS